MWYPHCSIANHIELKGLSFKQFPQSCKWGFLGLTESDLGYRNPLKLCYRFNNHSDVLCSCNMYICCHICHILFFAEVISSTWPTFTVKLLTFVGYCILSTLFHYLTLFSVEYRQNTPWLQVYTNTIFTNNHYDKPITTKSQILHM